MNWILLTVAGQFLNAVVALIDKHIIVSKDNSLNPISYTFFVALFSSFVLLFLPFQAFYSKLSIPDVDVLLTALASGATFVVSIYFLFVALREADPSEVIPIVGATAAIFTFLFSSIFLNVELPQSFLIGGAFLIVGMATVSHFEFSRLSLFCVVLSGVFFAFSNVLIKLIFEYVEFWDGFFWSRMANVLMAFVILAIPGNRAKIFIKKKSTDKKKKVHAGFLIILNRLLAGFAFFLIILAVEQGNVAVISALDSIRFVFIFIFAIMFRNKFPHYFSKKQHRFEILHKSGAIAVIIIGFFILFI